MKTDDQKKVLRKFMILCWAAFIAILGHMKPMKPTALQLIYKQHYDSVHQKYPLHLVWGNFKAIRDVCVHSGQKGQQEALIRSSHI